MSLTDLLAAVRSQPFEPFRLFLSDGTTYDVRHPETLIVGVRSSTLVVPHPGRPEFSDTLKLDNLHVTKTVPLTQFPAESPT